jgi:hypothetical protein
MKVLPVHFAYITGITAQISVSLYISAGVLILLIPVFLFFIIRIKKKKKDLKPNPDFASQGTDGQPLLDLFKQLNGASHTVLLAADRIHNLPVTIPINLAIRLAEKGTCLLIDFDNKRDAMAKVFEIDTSTISRDLKVRPVPTAVENLEIWPARYFDHLRHVNLNVLLEAANKKYDHILLYAPYLPVLPDRKQIAFCSKQAIVFSKHPDTDSGILGLLEACKCKIMGRA